MATSTNLHVPDRESAAYRRSIWIRDEQYDLNDFQLSGQDMSDIGLLQSIEAAKKRTPPAPISNLVAIARTIRTLPRDKPLSEEEFSRLVQSISTYGIGIKTAVCMLAVLSEGAFAPMDDKVSTGLLALKLVDESDQRALNGQSLSRFTTAYVQKVLPAWRSARQRGIPAQAIDEAWAKSEAPVGPTLHSSGPPSAAA